MPTNTTGNAATEPLLFTIRQAANKLSLSTWMVYQLADRGDLESVYQGRRRYITRDGLTAYVASLPNTPER